MHLQQIADFYLRKVITNDSYFSKTRVSDTKLLFKPFYDLVMKSFEQYKKYYPLSKPEIFETYRSNSLQLKYYNQGASKIKKNGMHHYSISADVTFRINGEITWHGDYDYMRWLHRDNGLHLIARGDDGHVQFIKIAQQTELRNTVDKAVRKFQKENKLVVDGIVGNKTIKKAKEIFK